MVFIWVVSVNPGSCLHVDLSEDLVKVLIKLNKIKNFIKFLQENITQIKIPDLYPGGCWFSP